MPLNMKDLTKGRPIKLIVLFALPILLGNIFQQTYNLADIMIIGQNLGNNSIAAVGTTAPVVSLMFNIINGSITGFAIIVAKHFGAGDHDEMHRTVARMTVFAGGLTVLIIAAMAVFIDPLLHALDVSETIFAEARSYLIIVAYGLVVTLLYNFEAGILRAVGDSVVPLVILVISTILNILLDLLTVCVFHMGVVGAALATVMAQAISAAVCLVYLIKRRPFLLRHQRILISNHLVDKRREYPFVTDFHLWHSSYLSMAYYIIHSLPQGQSKFKCFFINSSKNRTNVRFFFSTYFISLLRCFRTHSIHGH